MKQEYDDQLCHIEIEDRFYLDETGTCLNMSPDYGYARRGEALYDEKPTHSEIKVNTIAIATSTGMQAEYSYTQTFTAQFFIFYLEVYVLPIIGKNKTLIMDRHPVHTSKEVKEFLKINGVKYLYLPPYSPELNPIEEAFSKIKNYIKRSKPRSLGALLRSIEDGFSTVTVLNILNYFEHSMDFSIV